MVLSVSGLTRVHSVLRLRNVLRQLLPSVRGLWRIHVLHCVGDIEISSLDEEWTADRCIWRSDTVPYDSSQLQSGIGLDYRGCPVYTGGEAYK